MFKTTLAEQNWAAKYQYENETPLGTQERLACAVASVEPDRQEYWFHQFLNTLVKFDADGNPVGLKATFGGRITANAGTEYAGTTLHNCFISGAVSNARITYERQVPNTDVTIPITIQTQDSPDSLGNIMLTLLEQAETLKSEGGYGINFGFIRPRGTPIKGVGIKHPGVVHYMQIWDTVADVIVMGDNDGYSDSIKNYREDVEPVAPVKLKKQSRKGAQMAVLPIWHPDVEEFVRAKQTPGMLTKFNMSVLVDDAFMHAVRDDAMYDLHFNGQVYKTVKASELYDLIMRSTYNRAEPGILFYDSMQRNNPISYLGELNATNPCGEIGGQADMSTVCLLGSLNLTQYVNLDRTFDWNTYEHDVRVFARMLDNINDLSVLPLGQYQWATQNIRQYGMGVNGLGSALYMLGLRYGSPEGNAFVEEVTRLKEELTWATSAYLAQEKGPFPLYDERFLETAWFTEYTTISDDTKTLIKRYGVRNAKTTTNPPLGNSSVICDMVSNGIEPVFMHEYLRTYITDQWPDGLNKENVRELLSETQAGDATVWQGEYAGKTYYYEPHNRGLCIIEPVRDYGYQWALDHAPESLTDDESGIYATTNDLSIWDHVAVQEIVQRHCNQSVSKTANLPNDYDYGDFKALYFEAWRRGLNGFTTYRDGSMEAVLSKVEEGKASDEPRVILADVKLPETFVNGPMRVVKREGQKFYLHFSYLPDDAAQIFPVALWITTNNTGDVRQANMAVRELVRLLEDFGIDADLIERQRDKIAGNPGYMRVSKLVSMCLRHNLPIPNIITALDKVSEVYVTDLLFAVKKFLAEHVRDGTLMQGVTCDDCGGTEVIFESGCTRCISCGSAKCG